MPHVEDLLVASHAPVPDTAVRTPLAVLRDASRSLDSLSALFIQIENLAAGDVGTVDLAKVGQRIAGNAIATEKDYASDGDSTGMNDAVILAHRGLQIAVPVLRAIELNAGIEVALLARTGSVLASSTLADPANGWLTA